VRRILDSTFSLSPIIIAACAAVNETPDAKSNTVFTAGNKKGTIDKTPLGGQTLPIQIEGANAKWKNAQKNEKKNITSETIKSNTPRRKPLTTLRV
jgi:hypothetical protein